MTEDQIWAQLDLRTKNICDILDLALEAGTGEEDEEGDVEITTSSEARLQMALEALERGEEVDFDSLEDVLSEDEGDNDLDDDVSLDEMEEDEDEAGEGASADLDDLEEGVMDLHDPSSEDDSGDESNSYPGREKKRSRGKQRNVHGLNDGFFDLASFNAETEQAEARSSSRGRLGGEESDNDDDMSVDLFAPIQGDNFEEDDLENDPGGNAYALVLVDQCNVNTIKQKLFIAIFLNPHQRYPNQKSKNRRNAS
jgi:U3 small nucleolar RNA-associated protein MPP10